MTDQKPEGKRLKIVLPEGTVDAEGSEEFLARVREALVFVLSASGERIPLAGRSPGVEPPATPPEVVRREERRQDLRTFYHEKQPTTDAQATAVIAFYLTELAPEGERSESFDAPTVIKHFKLFRPLPSREHDALSVARRYGYIDQLERGRYKLTAIGYNLVAHELPAKERVTSSASPRRATGTKQRPRRARRSNR